MLARAPMQRLYKCRVRSASQLASQLGRRHQLQAIIMLLRCEQCGTRRGFFVRPNMPSMTSTMAVVIHLGASTSRVTHDPGRRCVGRDRDRGDLARAATSGSWKKPNAGLLPLSETGWERRRSRWSWLRHRRRTGERARRPAGHDPEFALKMRLIGVAERRCQRRETRPVRRSQLRNGLEQSVALDHPLGMHTDEAVEAPL
jgi:hypothetical protein